MKKAEELKRLEERKWRFQSLATGYERVRPLWLYPEIDCSSCVDDAEDQSGEGQLDYYIDYVQRRYPHWWEADAVPKLSTIETSGVIDDSELLCHEQLVALDNFLDHFAFRIEPEIG